MVFWGPWKVHPANLLKHILFASENAYNGVLGIALYVDWNAYRPAFAVGKVYLKDATLTTIHIPFIPDWDFAVRSESRDGGRYVFGVEGLH
jgi:hypothetical protein